MRVKINRITQNIKKRYAINWVKSLKTFGEAKRGYSGNLLHACMESDVKI